MRMASINPISTSIRMTLNLGVVEGKPVEKSVNISKLDNEITPETVDAVVDALEALLEYPVTETKQYETGLLVE
jgi:hypothetical protein